MGNKHHNSLISLLWSFYFIKGLLVNRVFVSVKQEQPKSPTLRRNFSSHVNRRQNSVITQVLCGWHWLNSTQGRAKLFLHCCSWLTMFRLSFPTQGSYQSGSEKKTLIIGARRADKKNKSKFLIFLPSNCFIFISILLLALLLHTSLPNSRRDGATESSRTINLVEIALVSFWINVIKKAAVVIKC